MATDNASLQQVQNDLEVVQGNLGRVLASQRRLNERQDRFSRRLDQLDRRLGQRDVQAVQDVQGVGLFRVDMWPDGRRTLQFGDFMSGIGGENETGRDTGEPARDGAESTGRDDGDDDQDDDHGNDSDGGDVGGIPQDSQGGDPSGSHIGMQEGNQVGDLANNPTSNPIADLTANAIVDGTANDESLVSKLQNRASGKSNEEAPTGGEPGAADNNSHDTSLSVQSTFKVTHQNPEFQEGAAETGNRDDRDRGSEFEPSEPPEDLFPDEQPPHCGPGQRSRVVELGHEAEEADKARKPGWSYEEVAEETTKTIGADKDPEDNAAAILPEGAKRKRTLSVTAQARAASMTPRRASRAPTSESRQSSIHREPLEQTLEQPDYGLFPRNQKQSQAQRSSVDESSRSEDDDQDIVPTAANYSSRNHPARRPYSHYPTRVRGNRKRSAAGQSLATQTDEIRRRERERQTALDTTGEDLDEIFQKAPRGEKGQPGHDLSLTSRVSDSEAGRDLRQMSKVPQGTKTAAERMESKAPENDVSENARKRSVEGVDEDDQQGDDAIEVASKKKQKRNGGDGR